MSATFLTHPESGELYVVTEGEYGSPFWRATPIGMADTSYLGLRYSGRNALTPCTNTRTLRAHERSLRRRGLTDCADVIAATLDA